MIDQAKKSVREQIKKLYSIPNKTPDQNARLVKLYRRYQKLEDQYANA